jgi:adenylyl-sulfate kinase
VAKLFVDAGIVVLTAFISPYRADRDLARQIHTSADDFIEVHVDAPLDVCESRDTKGLYKKARAGQIPEFTGISAPYEPPEKPELTLHTDRETVQESASRVLDLLIQRGLVRPE